MRDQRKEWQPSDPMDLEKELNKLDKILDYIAINGIFLLIFTITVLVLYIFGYIN